MEVSHKRMKMKAEGDESEVGGVEEEVLEETNEAPVSEETEANIQAILERIERFTQQQEGPRDPIRRKAGRKSYDEFKLLLHSDQLQQGHHGPDSRI